MPVKNRSVRRCDTVEDEVTVVLIGVLLLIVVDNKVDPDESGISCTVSVVDSPKGRRTKAVEHSAPDSRISPDCCETEDSPIEQLLILVVSEVCRRRLRECIP